MEKEMVANLAKWNVEMLKTVESSVNALVQSHKEHAAQAKELWGEGHDHLARLTAPVEGELRKLLSELGEGQRMIEMPIELAHRMATLHRQGGEQLIDLGVRMSEQLQGQVSKGTQALIGRWEQAGKKA